MTSAVVGVLSLVLYNRGSSDRALKGEMGTRSGSHPDVVDAAARGNGSRRNTKRSKMSREGSAGTRQKKKKKKFEVTRAERVMRILRRTRGA